MPTVIVLYCVRECSFLEKVKLHEVANIWTFLTYKNGSFL